MVFCYVPCTFFVYKGGEIVKKSIVVILMMFVLCFIFSFDSNATETTEDTTKDVNNITEGFVSCSIPAYGYACQYNLSSANGGRICLISWKNINS